MVAAAIPSLLRVPGPGPPGLPRQRARRTAASPGPTERRPATAESTRQLGAARPRIDAREKVTGTARYTADLDMPHGVLHARVVPAIYAHAVIRSIDGADALALPGVVAVLSAADLPIVGQGRARRFEPLARDEVVFAGQPVALVIAETEAAAEDAVELVRVDLEPLEPVVDVLAAIEPGAPLARTLRAGPAAPDDEDGGPTADAPAVGAAAAPDPDTAAAADAGARDVSPNVYSRSRDRLGDVAAAFAACDEVVAGTFRAGWVYQAYLEPHAAIAWLEPDGTLAVTSGNQGIFWPRDALAEIFGLPSSKVRVTGATLGGGFGSKQVVLEPLVAGAALRLRRPVRLVLTRAEDFAATKPHQGMVIELRIGARRSGEFGALEARLVYDAGAYADSSWEWFATQLVAGPYRWPAFDVEALAVHTNRPGTGNYRAPSGPQGVFALESLVDELADRLGLDPMDMRARNLVVEGDPMADGEAWPRIGAVECLERLREHPIWRRRAALPPGEGVGVAIGVWPGSTEPAAAACRMEADGTISVITGVVDISGSATGLAVIAAETFGLPVESVAIVCADTASAPRSPSSNASAITYSAGLAVQRAVADARDRFLAAVADRFEIAPDDLEIVDAIVRPRGSPAGGRPVRELAAELAGSYGPPVEGHAATSHAVIAPSVAGHLAHVRVDGETGAIDLLDYAIVQDVGRAIDRALVEGQMLGGTVQSIGRAILEELAHDERGQLVTGTFLDYAVPRAMGLPPIDPVVVEVPAPEGPFGAKGVGEASILPGPAAIANAVAAATGLRLRELPMSARRVWAAAGSRRTTATH